MKLYWSPERHKTGMANERKKPRVNLEREKALTSQGKACVRAAPSCGPPENEKSGLLRGARIAAGPGRD